MSSPSFHDPEKYTTIWFEMAVPVVGIDLMWDGSVRWRLRDPKPVENDHAE